LGINSMVEMARHMRYISTMTDVSNFKTVAAAQSDTATTESEARAASIARARAQRENGEIVSGEAVFEWLASWGTGNELPAPKPSPRRP
jgi:predicted transcriptional regulator